MKIVHDLSAPYKSTLFTEREIFSIYEAVGHIVAEIEPAVVADEYGESPALLSTVLIAEQSERNFRRARDGAENEGSNTAERPKRSLKQASYQVIANFDLLYGHVVSGGANTTITREEARGNIGEKACWGANHASSASHNATKWTLDQAAKINLFKGGGIYGLFGTFPGQDGDYLTLLTTYDVRILCTVNATRIPANAVFVAVAQAMALLKGNNEGYILGDVVQHFLEHRDRTADELEVAEKVKALFARGEPGYDAWLLHGGKDAWGELQS